MEKYETLELEVIAFETEDVITTSGDPKTRGEQFNYSDPFEIK